MKNKKLLDDSICIHIRNINIVPFFDDSINNDERENIYYYIDCITKDIYIDKTYVDFKDTKYQKVFMAEEEWLELCKTLYKTNFGQKVTEKQKSYFAETYSLIAINYVYLFLEDLGYTSEGIHLAIKDGCKFETAVYYDVCQEWKTYSGKWQSW